MPAHRADWWDAFIKMDEHVEAELKRREQQRQQQAAAQGRR